MTDEQQFEQYLAVLRSHLRFLAPAERDEIVREIGAHLRDSAQGGAVPLSVAIERLGSPAVLAEQYRDGALVGRASRSVSPVLLLRATLRLAAKSFFGVLVFLFGLFGYLCGGGLVLTGLGKLLLPGRTGIWVQDGRIEGVGMQLFIPQPPSHEALGWWYVPLALAFGSLLLALTTLVIRLCLRGSQRVQDKLVGNPLRNVRMAQG